MDFLYKSRINKTKERLKALNVEAVLVTSPANFFYYSGVWLDSNERLQAILISQTQEEAVMIVHEMTEGEVDSATHFQKEFWKDGENALLLLNEFLPDSGTISIDDFWPSHYLLELIQMKPEASFVSSNEVIAKLRLIKDEQEIELLRKSGKIADRVMEQTIEFIKPGVTESEVVNEVKRLFSEYGVEELSFNPIVGAGAHGAVPHHAPDDTEIVDGDMIVLDLGGIKDHYCSDMTRTVVVGEPTEEMENVYKIVQQAHQAGVQAAKPGVRLKDIDAAAREVIEKAGYGPNFTHRTGHGLGIQVHEEPYVTPVNEQILEAGMVISIEPGIYLSGKFGVRIEDIVAVTPEGGDRLNRVDLNLISIK